MLELTPTRRRLRLRQMTLADGTVLAVQARVPAKRDQRPKAEILGDLSHCPSTDTPRSALPTLPTDDFDPSV